MKDKLLFKGFTTNRRSPNGDLSLTGFTLIELMIVVIIIGVLAGIAIPRFIRTAEKARGVSCVEWYPTGRV